MKCFQLYQTFVSTGSVSHLQQTPCDALSSLFPCFDHLLLDEHDAILSEDLCAVVNIYMSNTQCLQARASMRNGDLGIRHAASLALSVILASAVATLDIQCSILSRCYLGVDKEVTTACKLWFSHIHTLTQWASLKHLRQLWMSPCWQRTSIQQRSSMILVG